MLRYSPTIALLAALMILSGCAIASSSASQNPMSDDHLSGLSSEARGIIFLNTLPDLDAYEHRGEVRCQVVETYRFALSRCRNMLREEAADLGGDFIILTSQIDNGNNYIELFGEVFRPKSRTTNATN